MKPINCACGKKAKYIKHMKFNGSDIDGWKCDSCGDSYYNPEKAQKILALNKLEKQKFELKLSQIRSNLVLRIPKEVSDVLNLHKGESVQFQLRTPSEIVIHPMHIRG